MTILKCDRCGSTENVEQECRNAILPGTHALYLADLCDLCRAKYDIMHKKVEQAERVALNKFMEGKTNGA